MADRQIAFTIQLKGTDQVFNSIAELEDAIRVATEELKNFTGTEADFKKLQDEIKGANNALNQIKEGTKGLSTEKQIGQYLKLGQVIVGAFGAAQTALSLFGAENEDVAAAAAKAQQILTLQYSLVTIAKEKDTLVTIANTGALILNTAATQGLRAAMTLLFATMRANPFGALLTVIGLVAGALLLLTNRTNDAEEAEKRYQLTLDRTRSIQEGNLRLLESSGAGAVAIARERLKIAQQEEAIADNAFFAAFKANRFSEETEKANIERSKRRVDRMVAENNLDAAIKEEQQKREDDLEKTREENERRRLERLQKLRQQLIQSLESETDIFRRLRLELKDYPEPNFFSKLQEAIKATDDAIQQFEGQTFDSILAQYLGPVSELDTRIQEYQRFQKEFKEFRKYLSLSAAGGQLTFTSPEDVQTLKTVADLFSNVQSERLKSGEITKEEFDNTQQLVQLYKNVNETITRIPSLKDAIFQDEDTKDYFNTLRNYLINTGVLIQDIDLEGNLIPATTEQSYSDSRDRLFEIESALQTKIRDGLKNTEDYRQLLRERGLENEDENSQKVQDLLDELARERVITLRSLVSEEVKYKNQIFKGYADAIKANQELQEKSVEGTIAIIGNNLDKFIEESKDTFDVTSEEFAIFFDDYVKKILEGVTGGVDLTERQLELLVELYRKFGIKINDVIKETTKEQKTQLEEFADKTLDVVNKVQVGLQAIQQAVSDYYNFQFDQLEKRNKRVNDTIVGDSKRAQELRIQQDKAYTAERERLEKQQAKIQLRLTLAQTIANVAQAVAQSLTVPLLAGVVAAAGAVQIGIITRQIATIDAYNRGGRIRKGQGGMVVGPSHEAGGVKFQGGGVELEGNEVVINRLSSLRYADILSSINMAGGGKPIVMSNFDDSRIVEAIAKQRQTPLRAYVVESDITNAQTINKRLELLSQI